MTTATRQPFKGINTDVHPSRLVSGQADIALNVVIEDGTLSKRAGFASFVTAVNSTVGILNMHVARFADGDTYVVVKGNDGILYHKKSTASTFTAITTGWTHNSSDRGWFFEWADRLHYFDRAGGSRWNPDVNSGTAYKAGMPAPATGGTATTTNGGLKRGAYHFFYTWINTTTTEEGELSPASGWYLLQPGANGGMYTTCATLPTDYEVNSVAWYCSPGNTEAWQGPAIPWEVLSYKAFKELTGSTNHTTLIRADQGLSERDRWTNAGGEPPGCQIGLFTGTRAVYGRIYVSAAIVPDKVVYSIPRFPTSVPKKVYRVTALSMGTLTNYDYRDLYPYPWVGEMYGGISGGAVAMAYGAGVMAAFGQTETYVLSTYDDGRIGAVPLSATKGCVSSSACIGTPDGVHAIGLNCWQRVTGKSIQDIADGRFSTTLAEIPVAYQSLTVMGFYAARNQVWAAVVKTGGTVAQRILIYDVETKDLVAFDPACLAAGEGITAMVEYAYTGAAPTMLIGTSAGRILQYPVGSVDVATGYACQWRGYFGTEQAGADQTLATFVIHTGGNCASNVTLGLRAMNNTGATITQETLALAVDNGVDRIAADDFARFRGQVFQVEFASTAAVTTQWSIKDSFFVFNQ